MGTSSQSSSTCNTKLTWSEYRENINSFFPRDFDTVEFLQDLPDTPPRSSSIVVIVIKILCACELEQTFLMLAVFGVIRKLGQERSSGNPRQVETACKETTESRVSAFGRP